MYVVRRCGLTTTGRCKALVTGHCESKTRQAFHNVTFEARKVSVVEIFDNVFVAVNLLVLQRKNSENTSAFIEAASRSTTPPSEFTYKWPIFCVTSCISLPTLQPKTYALLKSSKEPPRLSKTQMSQFTHVHPLNVTFLT